MLTSRSKTTRAAVVSVCPILIEKTKIETKKSTNIMENVFMPPSQVMINDNRKPVLPLNSLPVENIKKNNAKSLPTPCFTVNMNKKAKDISVPPRNPPVENTSNTDSVYKVKFKDNRKAVIMGCNLVDLSKKFDEKEIATSIDFGALREDKASSSCQLILPSTRSKRTQVKGAKGALQTKSSTDLLPSNKKRKCSSKVSSKEFVMPQDFIDQQRAYFKVIDEYELEVEEVEQLSVYEE